MPKPIPSVSYTEFVNDDPRYPRVRIVVTTYVKDQGYVAHEVVLPLKDAEVFSQSLQADLELARKQAERNRKNAEYQRKYEDKWGC